MAGYTWQDEFAADFDVPAQILALVDEDKLIDVSWHNDVCPSFVAAFGKPEIRLFVEHPDPELRENGPDDRRYVVVEFLSDDEADIGRDLCTDDLDEALATLNAWRTEATT